MEYVAFFSASNQFDGIRGTTALGVMVTNPYGQGGHVHLDNGSDFSAVTHDRWSVFNDLDLAFRMTFTSAAPAAVPEPASMALMGTGLAGVFGYGWRRGRRLAVAG